jgi:hypothetical protein
MMSLLIFAVIVFLGVPLTITLATPARYLKFYLLWLAMLAVLAIVWPSGADHSRFAGLGEILEAAWFGITTLFVIVKLAWSHVRRQLRAEADDDPPPPGDASDGFSPVVLSALTGLFVAPWSMFLVALASSATSPAVLTHGSALIVLIGAAVLRSRYRDATDARMQSFAGALLGSAIMTLGLAAAYVSSHIATVVGRAEAAASGHPYCIEIETMSSGPRPATSWLDLSPLMMRARCSQGFCFSRHASLAIGGVEGRGLMYWSYRDRSFHDDSIGSGVYSASGSCKPVHDFARRLPLF